MAARKAFYVPPRVKPEKMESSITPTVIGSTSSLSCTALVEANSDDEIVALYLSQLDSAGRPRYSPRTLESYRRDIKRYRLFLDQGRLAEVSLEDSQSFIRWLKEPPGELVDLERRWPINHPQWRPFYGGGLSGVAIKQQLASLKAFYRWLSDVGYVQRNPFALIKSTAPANPDRPKRQLYREDLQAVADYLQQVQESTPRLARQRWLWFGYLLSGLRLSELIGHTTGHLYSEQSGGQKIWMIAVIGKGRSEPDPHPLPDLFMQELWRYRCSLALDAWPAEPQPLVLSLSGRHGMTCRSSAYKEFKQLIQQVAEAQRLAGHYDIAARLGSASTHWLRHSFVTTLLDLSTDIPSVSSLARHRNISTTMAYDHSELPTLKSLLDRLATAVEPASSPTDERTS
jgi:integrase/recombinase XerD